MDLCIILIDAGASEGDDVIGSVPCSIPALAPRQSSFALWIVDRTAPGSPFPQVPRDETPHARPPQRIRPTPDPGSVPPGVRPARPVGREGGIEPRGASPIWLAEQPAAARNTTPQRA
ncbi:hypothetical protein MATL_G00237540 [Megalops atlanticus]|uniref:Uncharacterized protein n=1 Tax=Megalops atlanticus TaxID=7932 RepID=A0A9D3T1C1_MEGAT|nr:hypothetical protein MATL_G00237540 [Megalops atlanticus]